MCSKCTNSLQTFSTVRFTLVTTIPLSMWFTSQSNTFKVKPFPSTVRIVTCNHSPGLLLLAPAVMPGTSAITIGSIRSLVFLTTGWASQQQRQQHLFEEGIQGWPDGIKGQHISDNSLSIHPMRCPADKVTVLLVADC